MNVIKKRFNTIILKSIAIVLVIVATFIGYKNLYKELNDNTDINNEKVKEEKTDIDVSYKEYKNTSNFKLESLDRYIAYHNTHKEYDYEKIVTYVNIGLDKEFYSYIGNANLDKGKLVLCNKYLKLPDNYEPDDLEDISNEYFINGNPNVRKMRKEAKDAFERLSRASVEAGYSVYGQSAYRPYNMQVNLYNRAVNSLGRAQADIDTARPGHSEHQTGLTIDVSSTKDGNMLSFEDTDSFDWMQNNAHKYGFILRYRKDKVSITGFMYESWHYRYVGIDVATDMHDNYPDLSYEEYYYKFIDNK